MIKINRTQFDKVIIALLGRDHITHSSITHITMEAGKCSTLNGSYYADDKALELIGESPKRKKRRSY